jgi:hypothetical protein
MRYLLFVLLFGAILLTAACTNESKNVAVTTAVAVDPTATVSQTPSHSVTALPTLTEQPSQESTDNSKFLEAVEICYKNTPIINSTKTNLEFTICMQHTPIPTDPCARQFRSEILEYCTKDDGTTAGNTRSSTNMQIARVRFSNCLKNRLNTYY